MKCATKAYLGAAETPAGPLAFAVNEVGEVVYAQFREGTYPVSMEKDLEKRGYTLETDVAMTEGFAQEAREYTAGERRRFETPVAPVGTEWQLGVWGFLVGIPFGETRTYSELAKMVGRPGAARAVGQANATNRIPLLVPCHRVVGADGALIGFAGGSRLKERLLAHEREVSRRGVK